MSQGLKNFFKKFAYIYLFTVYGTTKKKFNSAIIRCYTFRNTFNNWVLPKKRKNIFFIIISKISSSHQK